MIIAVDGPSGVGKGTLAKALAEHYGYAFLDTGLLYRQVALVVLDQGKDPENAEEALAVACGIDPTTAQDDRLRSPEVSTAASQVAKHLGVREALLQFQRDFAETSISMRGGVVLDGRDIGTNILPHAEKKLYLTAHTEVRAERRYQELIDRGEKTTFDEVLAHVKARDKRDQERVHAPLRPAEDAFVLDTSYLTKKEVFSKSISFVEK